MKKGLMLLTVVLALTMTFGLSGCGGGISDAERERSDKIMLPIKDIALATAIEYAEKLSGEWGDMHAAMMESGEGDGHVNFLDMQFDLADCVAESKADYMYVLYPEERRVFVFTVDGYIDDPEDYGTWWWPDGPKSEQYEEAMLVAWDGIPAASGGTYWDEDDDGNDIAFWPAYAPIYDSEGNITAILAADVRADEVWDFPWYDYDDEDEMFDGPDYYTLDGPGPY